SFQLGACGCGGLLSPFLLGRLLASFGGLHAPIIRGLGFPFRNSRQLGLVPDRGCLPRCCLVLAEDLHDAIHGDAPACDDGFAIEPPERPPAHGRRICSHAVGCFRATAARAAIARRRSAISWRCASGKDGSSSGSSGGGAKRPRRTAATRRSRSLTGSRP